MSDKKMRPRIGIPGWMVKEAFGVGIAYISYLAKFGCPTILTPEEEIREDLALLVLPGGADIDTTRFNQAPGYSTGSTNQMLEYFDKEKLPKYIDRGVPIIAICRGMQSINVLFGGTLNQDIEYHATSTYPTDTVHELWWNEKYKGLSTHIRGKINSRHHQCIDDLGEGFEIIAGAREEKINRDIPEIIIHTTRPIYAVQHHPEDCPTDRLTPAYFNKFLKKQDIKEKTL